MSAKIGQKRAASPELVGREPGPKLPRTPLEKETAKRLIVILENANLETVKAGKEFQLLNGDDHKHILHKAKRDPAECRPDITHQCLLTLLDSPLNKAGMLQVYVHTNKNVLIEVSPHTRLPRTFKRFSGLMVQLLHKLSIRATNGPDKLLKVIQNPVTKHLPSGAIRIGCSFHADKVVHLKDFIPPLTTQDQPVVFVIGAYAHGNLQADYVDKWISFSNYALSGSVACGKVCCAFEDLWGVL
mmetsp:Transcript_15815/g.26192  ORF Transcript_15815/g.26192 Transcript_15815/m.26192 type:complete len:243 (+) Transcript_15815:18-746(+)